MQRLVEEVKNGRHERVHPMKVAVCTCKGVQPLPAGGDNELTMRRSAIPGSDLARSICEGELCGCGGWSL